MGFLERVLRALYLLDSEEHHTFDKIFLLISGEYAIANRGFRWIRVQITERFHFILTIALQHPDVYKVEIPKHACVQGHDGALMDKLPEKCREDMRTQFSSKFRDAHEALKMVFEIGDLMLSNKPVEQRLEELTGLLLGKTIGVKQDISCYKKGIVELYRKNKSDDGYKKMAIEFYNLLGSIHLTLKHATDHGIASFRDPLPRLLTVN